MNQIPNANQPQNESPGEEQNDQMNNLEEEQVHMDDLNQFLNNNDENNLEEYQYDEEYQNPADVGEEQNFNMNMGYMDNPADLGAEQNPAMEGQDQYMDDLGEELGMSRVQLYRKVKALTGLSPVELLRKMRLQKAYSLLLNSDKTISEIAYEVGFGTPSYFSSCFKKQFDKYPTDLRR